ncbi:hypothetical protein IWQ60_001541 [Tieghemiomyces parasiticus]|uniref:Myb-like domain-containing protein n=1 Tax=Tieghemiomyces parasiticus TaxID=78921 RepID=A0A9W8AJN6_9FUNG|nr:hypothetical protein IWQ60_001541 [Tieghemiomyces parasiticus]
MATSSSADVLKPRSMPVGQRNVLRSNDSASLWNCTLSPGWTEEEVQVLRKSLIKFGIGNWAKIVDSQCLIGKTIAQMNLQSQRMLGQQSTAEFAGLHIDPFVIGELNSKKQGPGIKRKNNCIVNTGELPKPDDPLALIEAKRAELRALRQELQAVSAKIAALKENGEDDTTMLEAKVNNGSDADTPVLRAKRPRDEDVEVEVV